MYLCPNCDFTWSGLLRWAASHAASFSGKSARSTSSGQFGLVNLALSSHLVKKNDTV